MPTVNRTYLKFIKKSDSDFSTFHRMCYLANNIINSARYHIRMPHIKAFHKGHLYPFNYNKLWAEFKFEALKGQTNLTHVLGGGICQQILRMTIEDYKTWVKSLRTFHKSPQLYHNHKPKMPYYNNKHSYATFRMSSQVFDFNKRRQTIILCKNTKRSQWWKKEMSHNIKLNPPQPIKKIKSILVVPEFNYIELAIVCRVKIPKLQKDNGRYFSIDPGYNNLMAIASNIPEIKPLLIKNGYLKHYNYNFYQRKSSLQSKLPKKHHISKRIRELYVKQHLVKYNVLHKACNKVINYAKKYHISKIIFGSGASDAQHKSNLNKIINQGYCDTPFGELFKILQYKGIDNGINVISTEESYTSQSSFLNNEKPVAFNGNTARKSRGVQHYKRRYPRGLFTSYVNNVAWIVNSDINGALQIMKKQIPNAFIHLHFKRMLKLVRYPKVINLKL